MNSKLLIPIIFLLLSSYVTAESISTFQEEYWLGETVQSEIVMENFDLNKLSLLDNQSNKISVGFLTLELDDKEFVYFNIPTTLSSGDYYLTAKEKRVVEEEIQDFEISSKITVVEELGVSINPAIIFIDSLKDEFKISLKNNAQDTITVNITTSEELKATRNTLQINSGETKNAFISYSELESEQVVTFSYLNRSYDIRIIIPSEEITVQDPITEEPSYVEGLKFEGPRNVDKTSNRYTSFSDSIIITSTAKKELNNIRFIVTGNLKDVVELKITALDTLSAEGTINQYLWVNKEKKATSGVYEGDIIVKSDEGYSDVLHMKITLEDLELIDEEIESEPEELFNQTKVSMLLDESIPEEESEGFRNPIIALSMLFIVVLIIILISLEMRKKTIRTTLKDYAKSIKK